MDGGSGSSIRIQVDAVMVYAQPGHGRRALLHTDYTFAVRDGDTLVPFAKAYSGLTDAEIREMDAWIRRNTVEKFGPVRSVKPEQVFELGFEGIQASPRHKSGIAVRFPRIAPLAKGQAGSEADTLDTLGRCSRPRRRRRMTISIAPSSGSSRVAGMHSIFSVRSGEHTLPERAGSIHAATGTGKTYAAWWAARSNISTSDDIPTRTCANAGRASVVPFRFGFYGSRHSRALAADTAGALARAGRRSRSSVDRRDTNWGHQPHRARRGRAGSCRRLSSQLRKASSLLLSRRDASEQFADLAPSSSTNGMS